MIAQALASLLGLAAGALAALFVAGPPLGPPSVAPLAVRAAPVALDPRDPARDRVGWLRFLGGLELRARDRRFGGLSALLWEEACKRLLAVTDRGAWVILEPDEADDRLVGIRAAWMGPIRDAAGRALAEKRESDAEALARRGDETIVAFEQDHRLQRYRGLSACAPDSLAAPAAAVDRPAAMRGWPANGGAEAIAPDGEGLLILSEEGRADAAGLAGLRLDPAAPAGVPLVVRPPRGFAPTALDALPGAAGRHVAVFRRFTPATGVAAVIAELETSETAGGVRLSRVLGRLAPPLAVDNFEAVASRDAGGRIFLYLASDDNFRRLQRTLLLKFEILPEGAP